MKGKKNKRFRSILETYEIHFQFSSPYKMICDGNFLARAIKINLDLKKKIGHIFKQKIQLVTTRCVQNELKLLGSDFDAVYQMADSLYTLKCFHDMAIEPSLCIQKHIGSNNKGQFLVGTCDMALVRDLDKIPKTPILTFVSSNVLEMRDPGPATLALLDKRDKNKFDVAKHEREEVEHAQKEEAELLKKRTIEKSKRIREELGIKLKKPAIAPNPLSMLKKKKKTQ